MKQKSNRNKTKGLIALSLYSLMLKRSYEEISVKDICERAGVSRMSFYRYYNKKDDVFLDYCDERFEEFYAIIAKSSKTFTSNEFTLEIFKFIKKYYRQIKILKMANKESMLLDQLNSYTRYVISNLKRDFFVEQKNNPVFASFVAGGLFNIIMYWVNTDMKMSPEEMNNHLYQLLKHLETNKN